MQDEALSGNLKVNDVEFVIAKKTPLEIYGAEFRIQLSENQLLKINQEENIIIYLQGTNVWFQLPTSLLREFAYTSKSNKEIVWFNLYKQGAKWKARYAEKIVKDVTDYARTTLNITDEITKI